MVKKWCMQAMVLALLLPGRGESEPTLPPGYTPPLTVFERVKRAGTAKEFEGAPYIFVLDSTVNRVSDVGIAYTDSYVLYKVLTEEGCRNLAVLNWGYEPLSSHVDVKSVSVIRGDTVISVSVDGVRDLPAPQSMIYWGNRIELLQLPRLHVGDGIEVRSFRKGYSYALLDQPGVPMEDERYIPPMRGEYFDIVLFEATVPIVEKRYQLALPSRKRLHSQVYNGPMYSSTSYSADTTFYIWWAKDMPAWKPERSHPDDPDILTKVVLATVESWEAKSRWFFEVNNGQFAATEPIREKVTEILTNAGVSRGTDEQKAFELVHWVAQNIRYSGQTMGKGEGFTLHPGDMIFEQRSGVCKDIAGMLVTMMRAAGLEANPAMTMAGSRIDDVPADQFNHCVVALHKPDGSYEMYDPTWVPDYKDIWSKYESEQHYLVGSATGERLNRIRYSAPEESPMRVTSKAKILADGTLEGELSVDSDGAMDSRLRRMLVNTRKSEMNLALAKLLRPIDDRVELLGYQHGNPLDFKKSMWWKISFRVLDYARRVDSALEFKSPLMQVTTNSPTLLSPVTGEWPEKRNDDVFLYTTQLLDGREFITLPPGYKVNTPKNGSTVDETYAAFHGSAEMKGQELLVTQRVEIRRRQIPPGGYTGFRKALKETKAYAATIYRAEKGGTR
ncbi:MAG: DUF3857 domain-containing transglutaminase family protein [Candidatus Zixiibacteriota bacterium]